MMTRTESLTLAVESGMPASWRKDCADMVGHFHRIESNAVESRAKLLGCARQMWPCRRKGGEPPADRQARALI